MKSVWDILLEYEFMGGPGMQDRPDASGIRMHGAKKNFTDLESGEDWPYDGTAGGGPINATGDTGQSGVGRGGVGWGGRKDVSGGIRLPSATYDKTWQNEEFGDSGGDRHGEPRNVWKDTPSGEHWTEINKDNKEEQELGEAMGTPINFGMSNKSGNMMGQNIPGRLGGEPPNKKNWIPDDEEKIEMKIREFFDPAPIPVEEVENPNPFHEKDQSDEDLETKIDRNYGLESNDDFAKPPKSPLDKDDDDDVMDIHGTADPEGFGQFVSAIGGAAKSQPKPGMDIVLGPAPSSPGGLVPPGSGGGEVVDKASAWDVLQKVVDALGNNLNDGCK